MAQKFKNTMSMRFLSEQLYQLETFGFPTSQSLAVLSLSESQLDNITARIPIVTVEKLYRHASKVLNEPHLGLRTGHNFRILNYAQTGTIYALSKTIKQAIELNSKYQRIAIDAGEISYETVGLDGRSGHFLSLLPHEEVKNCHHVLNLICGAYATTFNWLAWGLGKNLKSVFFNQRAPEDLSLFHQLYDCPQYFDLPALGIEFDDALITAPLPTHDSEKFSHIIVKLDKIIGVRQTSKSLEQAVRASIRAAMAAGQVSSSIVASRLELSERQFRETMKENDLKYSQLLESERQSLFQHLYDKGESFSVISHELCYNDQAAFNRAFKRWHGVSPSQYVASH